VDFARDILPLLSNTCFVCHGPDGKKKDLVRLDSFEAATKDLGGHRAIDPNDLGKSEILARIHDLYDPMPPKKSGKTLTDAGRALITRWINEGGKYAKHWSFVPPKKAGNVAAGEAIDAHISARLRKKGLAFAPEANRRTLARRAALVLTGLPPEPGVLASFIADQKPDAYGRLVDTLMADPRFGENQARYWLDAVRYGDTHGLHLDNRRGIYPYRDWIVRAFNDNLPLDDFITWQIAGDLLPSPTLAQRVATGYVRMNPTTAEGGAIPAEFQAKNNFDRTETLGTVMLGMTMTCARCHTHKYDPIAQREYYGLFAFFNSTSESSMDGNRYAYAPVVSAPANQAGWEEWARVESEMIALVSSCEKGIDKAVVQKHARAAARFRATDWRVSKALAPNAPAPSELPKAGRLPGVMRRFKLKREEVAFVTFRADASVDQVVWIVHSGGPGSTVQVDSGPIARISDAAGSGTRSPLHVSKGSHVVHLRLTGLKSATALEVRVENLWKDWQASSVEGRLRMIADESGPFVQSPARKSASELVSRVEKARRKFTTTLVARDLSTPRKTQVLQRGEYNLPVGDALKPDVPKAMGLFPKDAPRNRLGLARWLTSRDHPLVSRVLINRIWQRVFGHGIVRTPEDFGLQGEQPTHPELLDWMAIELQDSGWNMKHMFRLMLTSRTFRQRSAWRKDLDDPENRLFARGPGHRLDAEVIRDIALWASGLLDPTMGGEGVKPYQPPGLWKALMHPASNTKNYVQDKDRRLYRRSLYVYWKRTSPHPMMTLFDAPSREASCVKRSRTSTPLQSLALFNETQRIEMSCMLAQRLLLEAADDRGRLDRLFTLLTCRKPTSRERAACTVLLKKMRSRYAGARQDALKLLDRPAHATRDKNLDPTEHAAWTQLVITVLASDAALCLN